MAYLENQKAIIMDKFHREKFSFLKFKMEMALVSMYLWDIVDNFEKASPSSVDPKMFKEYQRRIRKAMSIIGLNLADNQLTHIKNCK